MECRLLLPCGATLAFHHVRMHLCKALNSESWSHNDPIPFCWRIPGFGQDEQLSLAQPRVGAARSWVSPRTGNTPTPASHTPQSPFRSTPSPLSILPQPCPSHSSASRHSQTASSSWTRDQRSQAVTADKGMLIQSSSSSSRTHLQEPGCFTGHIQLLTR